jgi:hypothetical protein
MILFMLVAQAGEAFAVSSKVCFGSEGSMTMIMSDTDTEQMMEHECCQQECDCPIGLLSLAVVIELGVQPADYVSYIQQTEVRSPLLHTFIPLQKRPPISLFNLAA